MRMALLLVFTDFFRSMPRQARIWQKEAGKRPVVRLMLGGALTVWAWAASRIMDYFETDPQINEKQVAVVGHSRGGKTALWCTAQDERFAMAVSSCAGNSGDALARGQKESA